MNVTCLNCPNTFPDTGRKKFCSPKCKMAHCRKQKAEQQPAFDVEKLQKRIKELEWVAEIEDYCGINGLIPADLISFHKEHSRPKPENEPKNDIRRPLLLKEHQETIIEPPKGTNAYFLKYGTFD